MHYLSVLAENGQVDGIHANYSVLTVSLTDICLKPLGQDCATQSVLQVFLHLYLRVLGFRISIMPFEIKQVDLSYLFLLLNNIIFAFCYLTSFTSISRWTGKTLKTMEELYMLSIVFR